MLPSCPPLSFALSSPLLKCRAGLAVPGGEIQRDLFKRAKGQGQKH